MKQQRKEILFILISLNGGGAEKACIDMLRNFDYLTYKVTLLLIYNVGVHLSSIPKEVDIIYLFNRRPLKNYARYSLILRKLFHITLKHQFKRKLLGRNFDCTISYTEGFPLLVQSFYKNKRSKRIAWVHCDMDKFHWCKWHFMSKTQEINLYKNVNEIICVSQQAKDAFLLFKGNETLNNIHVIHNVIDSEHIRSQSQRTNIPTSKFTICNVGRLVKVKRQDLILHVAVELKKRGLNFDFWILGTGNRENELKELASSLNIQDNIKFLGFQSNPYPYIAASDLFLLTSESEGYPLVVCESLCLGIPVISTNITGTSEILSNGSGILTSFDVIEIADQIESLYRNHGIYLNYVQNAHKRASEFTPDKIISQIERLIN